MATKKTKSEAPAAEEKIAQMPPPGEENKSPSELAQENKSDRVKDLEKAADARIATGGQSGAGSNVPAEHGAGDVTQGTMTGEELAGSKHPLAPEKPLEAPDAEK